MEEFSDQEFWQKVRFSKKYDSLAYFLSEYGKKYLRRKFNEYNYQIPKSPVIKLGKKIGEDGIITKDKKTIKDYFNE